jgi:hypothetical protein
MHVKYFAPKVTVKLHMYVSSIFPPRDNRDNRGQNN